jgi:hypothetical protein
MPKYSHSVWDKRHAVNREQTTRRLARPPKLGRSEPGGGRGAFEWARTMFDDLGSRIISLDVVRRTTDVIIEGKLRFQIGHPASSIGMPPADVDMGQGEVASSVIPQVPPMEAGAVSIGPATDTFHIEKPRSDDATDKPVTGDQACECGKWRAPSQNRCECGRTTFTFVGDTTDATALIERSGPDKMKKTPAPQSWGDATSWTSQAAVTAATSAGGDWGIPRRFHPKPSKTPVQPAASAVMGVPEQDCRRR